MAVEVELNTIGSGFNRALINENFVEIESSLQDALSRTGASPNNMEVDLDLNSNDLLNVSTLDTERLFVDGVEIVANEALAVGPPGVSATITVGTVTTGAEGTDVIVTNVGDEINAVFDITIPRGDTGASGAGSGDMVGAQNLSDVADAVTAFTNIKQAATESTTGVVELATTTEANVGTDTTRAVTPAGVLSSIKVNGPEAIIVEVSSEDEVITTGTGKRTFRMPFALTVSAVRASLTTVSSSGAVTVDINEGGTSILSTKLTIDASEETSATAAVPVVISDSALADNAKITIDIDGAGTGATGLKVTIIGTRP